MHRLSAQSSGLLGRPVFSKVRSRFEREVLSLPGHKYPYMIDFGARKMAWQGYFWRSKFISRRAVTPHRIPELTRICIVARLSTNVVVIAHCLKLVGSVPLSACEFSVWSRFP